MSHSDSYGYRFLQSAAAGAVAIAIPNSIYQEIVLINHRVVHSPSPSLHPYPPTLSHIIPSWNNIKQHGNVQDLKKIVPAQAQRGALQFGFYDTFKHMMISHGYSSSHLITWMTASISTEVISQFILEPQFFIAKQRIQLPHLSTISSIIHIIQHNTIRRLYRGLPHQLLSHIPRTMVKFCAYEWLHSKLNIVSIPDRDPSSSPSPSPSSSPSLPRRLISSCICGGFAGMSMIFFCHPLSLLSWDYQLQLLKIPHIEKTPTISPLRYNIIKGINIIKVWYKGIGTRMITTGIIVAGQFMIYETCKWNYGMESES